MPVGMKLHELHVDQLRARVVGERVAVAGVLPAIARDLVRPADAAGGEHDCLCAKHFEPPALAIVAERADDALAVLQQRDDRESPCGHRCPDGCHDPAACESFPDRCDRQHARAADIGGRQNFVAGCARPSCDRTPRPTLPVRARDRALPWRAVPPCAIDSHIGRRASYRRKWTFQLSRSSTLASAAAMPPSAMTVCALPSRRFANHPDFETPAAEASMAARNPAPPAPITSTSCSNVSYDIPAH